MIFNYLHKNIFAVVSGGRGVIVLSRSSLLYVVAIHGYHVAMRASHGQLLIPVDIVHTGPTKGHIVHRKKG